MIELLVDTDVGLGTPGAEIDDGAALIMLLRAPGLLVRGLTTVHGNVPLEAAGHNARRLLAYLGREEIRVGRGAERPLVQDPTWFQAWQAGYGPTPAWPGEPRPLLAANLIVDTVRAYPGRLTLLALGPLTNLALAVRLAPDIAGQVREVVAMGGSFDNATLAAEFNIRCDPEAAHIVFSAGWPLRLLGLNVTRQVRFTREDFARLPDDSPAVSLLKRQAPGWINRVEAQGWEQGGCALHDAVAVAALLDETLFDSVSATATVELADPARRGQTVLRPASEQQPGARIAAGVDDQRCHELIWSYLSQRET